MTCKTPRKRNRTVDFSFCFRSVFVSFFLPVAFRSVINSFSFWWLFLRSSDDSVYPALEEDDDLLLCRTSFGGRPAGTVAAGSVEATVELFLQAAPM